MTITPQGLHIAGTCGMIVAMSDEARAAGFYWIRIDGLAPEVAFWDREVQGWVLTGSEDVLNDEHPARVAVLAGPPGSLQAAQISPRLGAGHMPASAPGKGPTACPA